ncbi:hypothetical protein CXF68_01720 [Tenacibaculum sp. Bg11-29]|uniref:hypothetical protein n=1 Tax=Tenacibaculum sp. Bg11-29 TaxID=2058306 RepID=UPI000C348CA7|nr:hypothetical protein [Tenacibaculum sp. Bg11-29]PKH49482.1 hypothetical protein CXF68_01720 [Tenacibaculum sp. Bg11-29]
MKNKFLVVATLATMIFTSCSQDSLDEASKEVGAKVSRPYNALNYKELVPMLEHYDETRKPILEKALGHEDTRMNYFSIETIENYLAYVKTLSKEKGIRITGINFVSASYPENTTHGVPNYQTMVFMPTTEINGKNINFDPVQSSEGNVVTVKEMLGDYGYNWVYDSKEDYENRNKLSKKVQQNFLKRESMKDLESSTGNRGTISPPL